ncbi:uncharacterized protein LOC143031993 [Oratosquilla oratoria]|uniref:uncharacterized protein LOC143031993 n=1 Tax=Oratosquilla oratoria TaxID=337810 RepID=UPI003F7706B2
MKLCVLVLLVILNHCAATEWGQCLIEPSKDCCKPFAAENTAQFRQKCNWCTCDHGFAACTKIDCDGLSPGDYENEEECRGVVGWRKRHLVCHCSNLGEAVCI